MTQVGFSIGLPDLSFLPVSPPLMMSVSWKASSHPSCPSTLEREDCRWTAKRVLLALVLRFSGPLASAYGWVLQSHRHLSASSWDAWGRGCWTSCQGRCCTPGREGLHWVQAQYLGPGRCKPWSSTYSRLHPRCSDMSCRLWCQIGPVWKGCIIWILDDRWISTVTRR